MRYFIGYLIQGGAAKWHREFSKEIAETFGTWKIYEKFPPHITIFQPFEINEIAPVKDFLRETIKGSGVPGRVILSGYDHFADRVVFVDVTMDDSSKEFVDTLHTAAAVSKLSELTYPGFPVWHPHATLAYKLSPQEIGQIWEYVSRCEKTTFTIPFDNVTLFRLDEHTERWVVDESFNLSGVTA